MQQTNWLQIALSKSKIFTPSTWASLAVAGTLLTIVWVRDWSKPPSIREAAINPARAAVSDQAATQSGEMLLPDHLNLAFQQLVNDRASQIKADLSRETALKDRKAMCRNLSVTLCLERKMRKLAGDMSEAIDDDGTLRVSPSRMLQLNVEMQAMLLAADGVGVKDDETQRFIQVYFPSANTDNPTVSGVASTVQATNLYLEQRKVDRLAATGKSEENPKSKHSPNVKQAALGQ